MLVAFVISFIMSKFKQPLLIGYILTGVLAGPIFFNLLTEPQSYQVFSHIGIAFLLFIVGLQLNLKLIKEVGVISLITGLGQIVFTTIFGIIINILLGFDWVSSILIAVALTFSSTIIIVKLLSDINGLEQLYGKISLGFLLVQDFVAVIILMIIGTFSSGAESLGLIIEIVGLGILATLAIIVIGKYALPYLLSKIAHYKELLFLFVVAWCFGLSAGYEIIGFSLEIGALIAGIILASTQYQQEIAGRIKPLKDFFIILFFIFLGTQLIPIPVNTLATNEIFPYIASTLGHLLPTALILSFFVLIGNPLIVLILVTRFGYSARTGFLAGLTVSQISEFSLIMALLAQKAGFLTIDDISLITLIAIITITLSTYLVVYGEKIYKRFEPLFRRLERKKVKDALQGVQGKKHEIGLFGYRRMGPNILRAIRKMKKSYIIIEHNPQTVSKLKKNDETVVFGDASNIEFLNEFDFKDMNIIISSINDYAINRTLLKNYKLKNPKGIAIMTADEHDESIKLYEDGADYVIEPHHIGGNHIELLIEEFSQDQERFIVEKTKHLRELHDV